MSARSIVTLLTDFGSADAYVAAMKGVILSEAREAVVVDATHDIAPQDVRAAAWVLGQYAREYPEGTIHVAVVDPGVGTERDALLVEADGRFFLAPDNGLLSWVVKSSSKVSLWKLKKDVHRPGEVSNTFHGRDVFAYAAGRLAGGKAGVEQIAVAADSMVMPEWAVVQAEQGMLVGEIVHVDRFGNLITNISSRQVSEAVGAPFFVQAGPYSNIKVVTTYGAAEASTLIALFGSSDTLEIAIAHGSALKNTPLRRGSVVIVKNRHPVG